MIYQVDTTSLTSCDKGSHACTLPMIYAYSLKPVEAKRPTHWSFTALLPSLFQSSRAPGPCSDRQRNTHLCYACCRRLCHKILFRCETVGEYSSIMREKYTWKETLEVKLSLAEWGAVTSLSSNFPR